MFAISISTLRNAESKLTQSSRMSQLAETEFTTRSGREGVASGRGEGEGSMVGAVAVGSGEVIGRPPQLDKRATVSSRAAVTVRLTAVAKSGSMSTLLGRA
jgi:hypothetical protein